MNRIIVIGSSNIDITACIKSIPRPGETIGGGRLVQANGGKGANQAVAAARLGGSTLFVTCVGNDAHGHSLEKEFAGDGIDTSAMKFAEGVATGTALIYVAENGENCIAVAPGANSELLPEDIDAIETSISEAEYVLMQLEIPFATVERAVQLCAKHNVKAIINPAPMAPIPPEVLKQLYMITPNETEAEKLTGIHIDSARDAIKAAEDLRARGVETVIITLGRNGSLICTSEGHEIIPAIPAEAVDTTAAGDVFNGALVAALSEGKSITEAARFATMSASISVTRLGAQTSVPYRKEVEGRLKTI